jgi:uncharacterized repeat protein (TIGR03806 family)
MSKFQVMWRSFWFSATVTARANTRHPLLTWVTVAGMFACSSPATEGSVGSGGTSVGGGSGGTFASTGGALIGGAPMTGGAQSGGAAAIGGVAGSGGGTAASGSSGAGGYVPSGPCSPPVDIKKPVEKLSATGCMSASDPRRMADSVIPYDVNSPLWSDAALKTRGMVIPQGQKIHVLNCAAHPDECRYGSEDDGRWIFPVGTVLVKNFMFDDKLVETRLFVRRDEKTWVGYGYQWNEQQTEATVVPDEDRTVMFDTGQRQVSWTYPSRYNCMLCHNKPGGSSLGPETRQLNRVQSGENLLDKLERLNVFDAPLPKPYLEALPTPYDSLEGKPPSGASNEQLTRSYLHANCAFCHRADGNPGTLDLRYGVPLAKTAACNTPPMNGGAGLSTYTLLTPGKPTESVLFARMQTLDDKNRMPQIGTYVVDQPAVKLVSDWITAIQSCQ